MKKFVFVLVMLATLAAVVACAAPTAAPPQVVKETVIIAGTPQVVEKVVTTTPVPKVVAPKTLVICMAQEPESLYFGATSMLVASNVLEAVYDGPIDNRNYDYQPVIFDKLPDVKDGTAKVTKVKVKVGDTYLDVATDAIAKADKELELDQVSATFKYKEGLKWSDGQPLKASDSVFSFNTQKDKDSGIPSRFLVDRTASYTATDDRTVVWTGIPGFLYPTYYAAFFTPLPEHVLKGVAPKDIKAHAFARKPLGWGPFAMKEWISGDRMELEKNANYFRAKEGLPKVDRLVFRFIPDTNQLQAQLIAGQCDVGTQDGFTSDAIPFLEQAEKSGIIKPNIIGATVWEHIDFNHIPLKAGKGPRPEFFNDLKLRQAVAHAVNRKEIVDKILFGKTKVIDTYVPAEHWGYAKDVTVYPFDVKKAEALLDEAGWVKGADGIRAKGGVRFSITMSTTSGNKPRELIMQIVQANLKTVGIDVKLDFAPAAVLFARGKDDTYLTGFNYDLILFAWLTGVEVPVNLYRCDQIPSKETAFAGQNNTGWCNPDYDKAATGYFNHLDRETRVKFAVEAQKILTKDAVILPLYQRLKIGAVNPRVSGFALDPTQNTDTWNIETWDVK